MDKEATYLQHVVQIHVFVHGNIGLDNGSKYIGCCICNHKNIIYLDEVDIRCVQKCVESVPIDRYFNIESGCVPHCCIHIQNNFFMNGK